MPVAALNNIEKILGPRTLFEKLSFNIERGERVGLIGDNGAGKTTLFKMLTGEMTPDSGEVLVPRGTKIGVLAQDPVFTPGHSLIDEAELAFEELHNLAHELRDLEHEMGVAQGDDLDRVLKKYDEVTHAFEDAGGYAWRSKLEQSLDGVGLARHDWEKPVEALSGGQRSRLALAKLLVAEPDLLLLDEPTNHLDLAAVEWLEEYLLKFNGSVLVISHDRYLLDRLATRIVWLTRQQLSSYPGNFSAFQVQREHEEASQARARELQQADIAKQAEYIRRFQAGQRARQAAGRKKRLDRLLSSDQVVQEVTSTRGMHLKLSTDQRAGDQLLRVTSLTKQFEGRTIWKDLEFNIKRGERIGIIGPNGSGKTTLLRTLVGQIDADDGDIRWGSNLQIGYYDQRLDDFDPELSIYDEVLSSVDGYNDQQLRTALGTMNFRDEDAEKQMKLLSGGERARVQLVKLLLERPNVLLLDEPTNHLDIRSCESLERSLSNFEGTILCVSHDRYFLEKVANRLLILDPPGVIDFAGTWHDWAKKLAEKKANANASAKSQSKPAAKPAAKKVEPTPAPKPQQQAKKDNPYKRPFGTMSVSELEKQIAATEVELRKANEALADPATFRNADKSRKAQAEVERLTTKLEQLEAEYLSRGE
jgi:ATP-binding cassette subfamily F protein 3